MEKLVWRADGLVVVVIVIAPEVRLFPAIDACVGDDGAALLFEAALAEPIEEYDEPEREEASEGALASLFSLEGIVVSVSARCCCCCCWVAVAGSRWVFSEENEVEGGDEGAGNGEEEAVVVGEEK